ncbi:MAG: methylmalonyl-CoA mutase subunit beta [Pseudomonadota bacterium]
MSKPLTTQSLAHAFSQPEDTAWQALAEKALKGASLDTLNSKTEDKTAIKPLYPAGNAQSVSGRGGGERWDIVARIDDPDLARANTQALDDLEGGVSALSLVVRDAVSSGGYGFEPTAEAFDRVLERVHLHMINLRLEPHPKARRTALVFADTIAKHAEDKLPPVRFGLDPIGNFARYGILNAWENVEAAMNETVAGLTSRGFEGAFFEADGRAYHDAGATPAQELAAIIATANAYLRAGIDPNQIGFTLAVDQDQFAGIAKIRALRLLWAKVTEVWKAPAGRAAIHAETSRRMLTVKDPHTNMLRVTIACFAASVGGADSIAVLPYSAPHGLSDAFARRVARNTQLVLQEEANLYKVADPAAGSGAYEALTEDLTQAAWTEFQTIEAAGGIVNALQSGSLQARISSAHAARMAAIDAGETHIIGTTKFGLAKEPTVETLDVEKWPEPSFKRHDLTSEALRPV